VQVRRLVDCCRWLQEVDVVGVRGLPRGCKVCVLSLVHALLGISFLGFGVLMMLVMFILAAAGSSVDEHSAAAGAAV
jgi:hypothetical protein